MEGTFIAPQLKRKFRKPTSHPLYKYISSHGNFESLDISITDELKSETAINLGKIIITDKWIISTDPKLNLLHISDIVWAYKEIYTDKYSINQPYTYVLVLKSKNNKAVSFTSNIDFFASEHAVNVSLEVLSRRLPHAFFGYSDKLTCLWEDNKRGFIQLVEEKRLNNIHER